MKKKIILWSAWGVLYIICVPFAYLVNPTRLQQWGMILLSLFFFVPGALLLIDALRFDDTKTLRLLRWISGLSLGLTMVLLIANVASALTTSVTLGDTLYGFLNLVSVPMLCCRQWALSMLLWAIMLFCTIVKIPKSLDK